MLETIALIPGIFWFAPAASAIALVSAYLFYRSALRKEEGNDTMKKIARYVREGAIAYLKQQYKIVGLVFFILVILFCILAYVLKQQNGFVPFAFLTGGIFSGVAGFLGMKTATMASARTANAVRKSLNSGLQLAFRSGAVMGLVVVGLGLIDISFWYVFLNVVYPPTESLHNLSIITTTMLTFGMGASTQALFARVGGGIFTKAADVGADLVGKVESGIPEDDPRNPATIADNVGDNVGDVAGMGADLYESYTGSILAAAALGVAAFSTLETKITAILAPLLIAAVGILLSIIGVFLVSSKENATQKHLLGALNRGVYFASAATAVCAFIIFRVLNFEDWGNFGAVICIGLIVGLVIGQGTEYATSSHYKPTKSIAGGAETGPATVIISGIGVGMISTIIPIIAVSLGILLSFGTTTWWDFSGASVTKGLYGIALAAVGMLSTLGITLATDAYGPIADNAGGNAEMSGLGEEIRKKTDALDSLGNTTAATGKGFAIGSAALTALALLASYLEEIRIALNHAGVNYLEVHGSAIPLADANFNDFMAYFQVHLMNPLVLIGCFIGAVMSFLFCGMTMLAVGRAAMKMVEEVRRQFREIPGIMEGKGSPDYARCVAIATRSAQKEMIFPSLLAITVPALTGIILGIAGVMGLLTGGLACGFTLAVFMTNSGGAWDNAKKYIESGQFGGKNSAAHQAAVIGDTVGDPFKDTSGPSLNILIKLMCMVSIVTAGITITYSLLG